MNSTSLPVSQPEYVPLVECTRGTLVESVHYGSVAVVDMEDKVRLSVGSPESAFYARSSLKPLQLVAMLRAGLELPEDLLAIATASHSGASMHIEAAERILKTYNLPVTALRNVADLPYGTAEKEAWLQEGGIPTQLAQNCSGKHAAMLATCKINGWTLDDYLDPAHPLQRHVAATLNELIGEETSAVTVDGCGTPLFAYTLMGLARSYARLASAPAESPEGRVVSAIKRHPEMVAGKGRDVAALMRAVPTVFVKDGAEAVQLVGVDEGIGIAVKIADGGDRARLPITAHILETLGVSAEKLNSVSPTVIRGGGRPVGALRPAAALKCLITNQENIG